MPSETEVRLIKELKNYEGKHLLLTDFLYLFNRLNKKSEHISLGLISQFIDAHYLSVKNQWKVMEEQALHQIYVHLHQQSGSCSIKQQETQSHNVSEQKELQTTRSQIQAVKSQKQKIRVSFSNLIKEDTQSQSSLHQNKPNKSKIPPNNLLHTIESNVKNKIIHTQKSNKKTDNNNQIQHKKEQIILDQIDDNHHQNQQIYKIRQNQLDLIATDFEFKKQYFQTFQKNQQLQKTHNLKQKILTEKKSLNRIFKKLFIKYANQYSAQNSENKGNPQFINLKIFLKYFKEIKNNQSGLQNMFQQKLTQQFKPENLMKIFKNQSKNKKEINFEDFVQIHQKLFISNPEENTLDLSLERMTQNNEETIEQLEMKTEKLRKFKQLFKSDKISKLLNIKIKSKQSNKLQQTNFSNTQNSIGQRKQQNSENQNKKKYSKFIDRTLEDYESTRSQIHETFKKQHQKQKIHSLNQRLTKIHSIQNDQKNKNTLMQNKQQSTLSKKFKNKLLSQTNFKNLQGHSSQNDQKPKTTPIKKNLFDQIIRQVCQEDEQQQNPGNGIFRARKSKSVANLESSQRGKMKLKSFSSQKKLRVPKQLKSIFSLPKIVRLSQSQFQNQSIVKTLDYLHAAICKQEIPKIKKILQLNNPQKNKWNSLQNKFLKQYFNQQKGQISS